MIPTKLVLLLLAVISATFVAANSGLDVHPHAHHALVGRTSRHENKNLNNLSKRGLPANLGLSDKNLKKNGIWFGFLPAWGEAKSPNTASSLNKLLNKKMSVVGAYAQIKTSDLSFSQIDTYVDDILKQTGDKPVLALALMPSEGLASINQNVADKIAAKMAAINAKGITVWLRYAHEMNGDWYKWGQQPSAFIASWKLVSNTIRAKTPKTFMLWSPNSLYANDGKIDNPKGGYTPYWPGKAYVDIVGISFYHYGGYERKNILPSTNEAYDKMAQFDKLYASAQKLPMILSETGGAYTKDLKTGTPAPGGASEKDIKMNWLQQITCADIHSKLPYYKAAVHFEVIKDENAAGNSIVKEEDFRILTGNSAITTPARQYLNA